MNTTPFKLVACLAWGCVAVSAAAPANAGMLTTQQPAPYASCSSSWTYASNPPDCFGISWSYSQTIKLLSVACNAGGCGGTATTWVNSVYPAGRKIVSEEGLCASKFHWYAAGTCSC
jgi:hypothetical protein